MAKTFALQLQEFARKATAAPEIVVRKVASDLLTSVVLKTPVDTGRARASWGVGLNHPTVTSVTLVDKDGRQTIVRGQAAISDWKPDDSIWITSRLPYIEMLEYGGWNGPTTKVTEAGFSRQAPAGMVRISVVEFQSFVDNAVKALPK